MLYRGRAHLVAAILEVVNGRSLNGTQIKQYVSILIGAGLIKMYQEEGNLRRRRTYGITDKGLRFLQLHNQLGELLLPTTTAGHFSSYLKPMLH
jgi:predicted transcriptional regulator